MREHEGSPWTCRRCWHDIGVALLKASIGGVLGYCMILYILSAAGVLK